MKTSGQQNVLVSYKSLEQILLIVPSSYRMDEDNKFSYGEEHGHGHSKYGSQFILCKENVTENQNMHLIEVKQNRKIYGA